VLVVSGVQLFIMGILGEYLWRTLDVARHRPQFVVEQVLGFRNLESGVGTADTRSVTTRP
jgi:dolichol-phosphate mannosyltransferase